MRTAKILLITICALALVACSDDGGDDTGGSSSSSGGSSSGATDAGPIDGGSSSGGNDGGSSSGTDAGAKDAGGSSSGADAANKDAGGSSSGTDAGAKDAGGDKDAGGEKDSGPIDAGGDKDGGPTDAGGDKDAGPTDAGGDKDAGPTDAGAVDAGTECSKTVPDTEVCDGKDNDCDGKTDNLAGKCDDGSACTINDICKGKDGCQGEHVKDGTACTDANPCLTDDKCKAGKCMAGTKDKCDDGNACTIDSCDAKTGKCSSKNAIDGNPCEDGDSCTTPDTCKAGVCKAGPCAGGVLKGDKIKAGNLVVTELIADPKASSDSYGEWIELHNTTTAVMDIDGLTLIDKNGKQWPIGAGKPLTIKAGGYGVIGRSADKTKNGGIDLLFAYDSKLSLANSGGKIVLKYKANVLDVVDYHDGKSDWPVVASGKSQQLDPTKLAADNNSGLNWCIPAVKFGAGDYGTPGKANPACPADKDRDGVLDMSDNCTETSNDSQYDEDKDGFGNACDNCPKVSNPDQKDTDKDGKGDACPAPECGNGKTEAPEECDDGNKKDGDGCSAKCVKEVAPGTALKAGELFVTEFMPDPKAAGDSTAEWLELYNPGDKDLDLEGAKLATKSGVHTFKGAGKFVVKAKSYFVMCRSDDKTKNGGITNCGGTWGIALGNGGGFIKLTSSDGKTVVFETKYGGSDDKAGQANQMSGDKLAPTADLSKGWCYATKTYGDGDKGTPGAANDTCKAP